MAEIPSARAVRRAAGMEVQLEVRMAGAHGGEGLWGGALPSSGPEWVGKDPLVVALRLLFDVASYYS